MSKNNSKPYKKLTGRPSKDAEEKRSKKVSATFTEAEYTEIKNKATAAVENPGADDPCGQS